MFESRLRPIEPLQVKLSHQQYEDAMADAREMHPMMRAYLDRLLEHTRGCACRWEFNNTSALTAWFELAEVSAECPWHVARP